MDNQTVIEGNKLIIAIRRKNFDILQSTASYTKLFTVLETNSEYAELEFNVAQNNFKEIIDMFYTAGYHMGVKEFPLIG